MTAYTIKCRKRNASEEALHAQKWENFGDCKASRAFQSMPCRWAVMNFAPGGDTYFTCCINSSVHVAM